MKREVLEHYEELADRFGDVSNKYCNERYRREIEKYASEKTVVLDIGCGTGLLLSRISAKRRVGIDLSPRLLGQLRKSGLNLIRADAESLPFKEGSFGLVYSVNLLEHVPHPEKVVLEGLRVLQKGGRLVLITPNGDIGLLLEIADALKLKAPEGPHRFLTSKRLKRIIRAAEKRYTVRILAMKKLVLFPKGPKAFLRIMERIEPGLPLGFFHLVVIEKR